MRGKWEEESKVVWINVFSMDLWEKFIEVGEWCDDYENFFNYFKRYKIYVYKIILVIKNIWIIKYDILLCRFEFIKIL